MTLLDLATVFSGEDLRAACSSLGIRRPLGVAGEARSSKATASRQPVAVTIPESAARALAVLAAPEAIAVVDHVAHGRKRTTYVAIRGADAATHCIRGGHHLVESFDAECARREMLGAAGLDEQTDVRARRVLDVTVSAFDRMVELVAVNDIARAAAALETDGVDRSTAVAVAEASRRGCVHVLGLRNVGHRYVGCELSWVVGRERWLVPVPARAAETGAAVSARTAAKFVRAEIATVSSAWLAAELAVVFD